jgi:hypothetical protein
MSEKVELIAAAQVNAFAGPPSGIQLKSNFGFKSSAYSGPGAYELTLDDKHDDHKLVINVTRNNVLAGDIQASIIGTGDVNRIQINNFDLATGLGSDTPFFITVWRVRS